LPAFAKISCSNWAEGSPLLPLPLLLLLVRVLLRFIPVPPPLLLLSTSSSSLVLPSPPWELPCAVPVAPRPDGCAVCRPFRGTRPMEAPLTTWKEMQTTAESKHEKKIQNWKRK
jgi:hypothetical protein